jgi:hypothetical protein
MKYRICLTTNQYGAWLYLVHDGETTLGVYTDRWEAIRHALGF